MKGSFSHLKHQGWKQIMKSNNVEADIIDGLYDDCAIPQKVSMRKSARFGNSTYKCVDRAWGMIGTYDSVKYHQLRVRMRKFIEAHVGKSYNKTYSEFKEKFPETFGRVVLAEEFKERFLNKTKVIELRNQLEHRIEVYLSDALPKGDFNYRIYNPCSRRWNFYVDDNGIIRDLWKEFENKIAKVEKPQVIETKIRSKETLYQFANIVFIDEGLEFLIEAFLSKNSRQYLDKDIKFTEKNYESLVWELDDIHLRRAIYKLHSDDWWKKHYPNMITTDRIWDKRAFKYINAGKLVSEHFIKNVLFKKTVISDSDTILSGSTKHRQWLEDNRKSSASYERAHARLNEAYRESLLHDIMQKRKAEEHKNDIVDRDRLGFDEDSFKGEFYHGQKRKRNKKNK